MLKMANHFHDSDALVGVLSTQWGRFCQDLRSSIKGTVDTPWARAMFMLADRAVENLNAIRILARDEHWPAAQMVYRSLYESLLNVLTVGFHDGEIDERHLSRRIRPPFRPTKQALARRFLALADYEQMEFLDTRVASEQEWLRSCIASGRSEEQARIVWRRVHAKGAQAHQRYGYGDHSTWSPFKHVHAQREHLWPDGGNGTPRFPSGLIQLSSEEWREFFYFYRLSSHFVHGSSASHVFTKGSAHHVLDMALWTTVITTAAYADARRALPRWNMIVGNEISADAQL